MSKINVQGIDITILSQGNEDYISLTNMVSGHEDGPKLIEKWINNKSTVDFLGVWEQLYNPDFKTPEFRGFRENVGSGSFFISVKRWTEATGAVGIFAKKGRYGGTFAHKDIAFEFGSYISPHFKLILIKEFQRLKEEEARKIEGGWDHKRFLSKVNYSIHTDAIKDHIIPDLTEAQAKYVYANEADILNVSLFGMTAKQWREKNPDNHLKGYNIRDFADSHQLLVMANLESTNAYLISKNLTQEQRLYELRRHAVQQLESLRKSVYTIEKIQSPFKAISST